MNEKDFMIDADPADRLAALREQADSTEEGFYYRPLSQDELDQKREILAENSIRLSELDDEFKEVKADFKGKVDPLKLSNKSLLKEIKQKQEYVNGTLFNMRDYDDKTVTTYNERGEFIGTRRLRPDEKQSKLFIPTSKAS